LYVSRSGEHHLHQQFGGSITVAADATVTRPFENSSCEEERVLVNRVAAAMFVTASHDRG
jgi:hypothetical protein